MLGISPNPENELFPQKNELFNHTYQEAEHYLPHNTIVTNSGIKIDLLYDRKDSHNVIRYEDKLYTNIYNLVILLHEEDRCPLLFAQIINFLYGKSDVLIENPKSFIDNYDYAYCKGVSSNPFIPPLCAYNHYDTSKITFPEFCNNELVYYVESRGIPYKVSCPWPPTSNDLKLKYSILEPID